MPLRRWLIGACLGLFAVTGCNCGDDGDGPPPPPPVLGNGTIGNIKPAAHDAAAFTSPLDATPSPDGTQVYFTAIHADGPAVFKASAAGGGVTPLHIGAPISGPFGITVSSDNQMVYVSDPGASVNEDDRGAILMVSTAGGTPTPVSGTAGYAPRGIVLVKESAGDQLYFTGKAPEDGQSGVFKVAATGGAVSVIAKGGPLADPNGLAVTTQGTVYVVDAASSDVGANSARIIEIPSGGTPTVFAEGLKVGFPAGIALSQDNSVLLVSAIDPAKRTDAVARIVIGSKEQTLVDQGISTFEEPAGLHRAANAEVYAWADSGADGSGTVYVLTP